jgi:creatinine amidohydrolase
MRLYSILNNRGDTAMARWEMQTSPEIGAAVAAGRDLAILPVGATEQHGPHLATGTDTISADLIARAAAEETGALVLPAIPYGCSLGHTERWPGTISLTPIVLTQLVTEIARWAVKSGIRRMIFFSGHATNGPSLASAILQLRYDYPDVRFRQLGIWEISPDALALYLRDGEDVHANRAETSLLLHLAPEMVRNELAHDVQDVTPGRVWSYAMPRTTPTGVVGRPTEASAIDGEMMHRVLSRDFATFLRKAMEEDWPTVPSGP